MWAAAITTTVVTVLAYVLPFDHQGTGIGLAFLAATYFFALRNDDPDAARRFGLSLGGLLDPEPISLTRIFRDAATSIAWAFGLALVFFPLFWIGYVAWWSPRHGFAPVPPGHLADEVLGELLVIALPEEAFYRGYLQTAFDEAWPSRRRLLGANLGIGLLAASVWFAIGHVATELYPGRLAVFFPALVFGWLRVRTRGIGAPLCFHALCNLFAWFLAKSYGLAG